MSLRTFAAVLATTSFLVGGAAFAADQDGGQQAMTPPPGHSAVVKDFGKLSADGVRSYQELTLARLAIFDGRTADAKKYVDDAATGFDKAKSDESVFKQAEATMRSHMASSSKKGASAAGSAPSSDEGSKAASGNSSGDNSASNSQQASGGDGDVDKPVAWLPVDGTVSINEDFTMKPAKAKAVEDANKSLAKGDKKGAMEKLKLADVDTAVTLAVVPLQQTIDDVNQAKQLIDSGKFYEGSQKLRAVQASTLFTVADMPGMPSNGQSGSQQGGQPATH